MDGIDLALARAQEERRKLEGALLAGAFDTDLYAGAGDRFDGYDTSMPASGDDEDPSPASPASARRLAAYTGYAVDPPRSSADGLCACAIRSRRIVDREDDYRRRRLGRAFSPERHDAFAAGEAAPDPAVRTYADAMRENLLQHQKEQLLREIAEMKGEEKQPVKRRTRRDVTAAAGAEDGGSDWDEDATDAAAPKKQRSRWDDDETPLGAEYLTTPTTSQIAACGSTTPEQCQLRFLERDREERSRPLADDELDAMFPKEGYKILEPPASYQPMRTPAKGDSLLPRRRFSARNCNRRRDHGQRFNAVVCSGGAKQKT